MHSDHRLQSYDVVYILFFETNTIVALTHLSSPHIFDIHCIHYFDDCSLIAAGGPDVKLDKVAYHIFILFG